MADVTPDIQIDCRNMQCPLPVMKTRDVIDGMEHGQVVEVLGTDPKAKDELEIFAKENCHHFLGLENDKGGFTRYLIRVERYKCHGD